MKKAKYIVFEGTEGVFKTTQAKLLTDYLRSKGYKVLQTKEPGSEHIPLTMELRKIMLDNKYDSILTGPAREFLSQAIRSIHLERLIVPALSEYDYIIQDRGILSGYAYGKACGNDASDLERFASMNINSANKDTNIFPTYPEQIYDEVILLSSDPIEALDRAKSVKQEFASGDAMESRGDEFIISVADNMSYFSSRFNTSIIYVDNKSREDIHHEILSSLNLKDV